MMKRASGYLLMGLSLSTALGAVFLGGCALAGLLGAPTRHEKKVKAEYSLSADSFERLAVLVDDPGRFSTGVNVRLHLTGRIASALSRQIRVGRGQLIGYDQVSGYRSSVGDFSGMSVSEIGAGLGADLVLLVMVEDHDFVEMDGSGYYKGSLACRAALYDVAGGRKLWPGTSEGRKVAVSFDVGVRGRSQAVDRLMSSAAHCVVRYLYDCPLDRFKIVDDKSDISWESWKKTVILGGE